MPDLKLFVAPNTCARVATIVLEEIGAPFETELVRIPAGQQNSPEYRKINPKGKVPAILIDGVPLTENVAILSWLAAEFPEAGVMPKTANSFESLEQTADLAFFAGTVHPTTTRISMPIKFIEDKEASFKLVRPVGIQDMRKIMDMIEARLEDGPWWYGDAWSAVDAYLYWVWGRIAENGFPTEDYPNLRRHHELSNARPAVQRAMAREAKNVEILRSEGLLKAPK